MRELRALGLVADVPRRVAAAPYGPLAAALERALETPAPVRGEGSIAFSIATRYGTWQGLAALRESRGLGVQVTDEGIFEGKGALGGEEGVFVEPSSAAALTAVMQLVARKAVDPEQTIVLVLTSSGLKDPGAPRAGLGSVWLIEDYFSPGAFALAGAAAAVTERVTVGIGVVNPYTRHPALLAMETAALAGLAPGRVVLGLGASNRVWIEERMGIPFTAPLASVRECVEIVRRLLAGERLTFRRPPLPPA